MIQAPYKIESYRRGYRVDGEYYPRITTILDAAAKPQLVAWKVRTALERAKQELSKWNGQTIQLTQEWIDALIAEAAKEPEKVAGEAADIGTRTHEAIDKIIRGQEPEIDHEIEPGVNAFLEWHSTSGIKLEPGEIKVASKRYGYAGTMDGIGRRGKDLVLLDWKTSSGIYGGSYAWQLAAYANAWEEMTGEAAKEAWVVRFSKDPEGELEKRRAKDPNAKIIYCEAKRIANIGLAFEAFLACKGIYDANKREYFD